MHRWHNIMSTLTLVAISGFLFSGIAFGASFANGSFESPGGAPIRQWLSYPGNPSSSFVTGWISNGGFQIYESSGQDGIPAGDGTYYVSFGHNGNTGGTLSQTFDTISGGLYTVNYLVTLQQGGDPEGMKVEAFNGTTLLNGVGLNNFIYQTWTGGPQLTFTAASQSTTLIFTDTTIGGGSANWGLDAVTVNMAPVPVPPGLLLLGPGLVGLAAVRRRFKK